MKIIEKTMDILFIVFIIIGVYFFRICTAVNGINNAVDNNSIILFMGIEIWLLNNTYINKGIVNGTAKDVVIINPTITGNLPPTKFATNGDPSPVEIPDNKKIDNKVSIDGFGCIP